jgi:hypothetical protein
MMVTEKQTKTEYSWVKYSNDEGLYTIRKTTTVDIGKTYSKWEAESLIAQLEGVGK